MKIHTAVNIHVHQVMTAEQSVNNTVAIVLYNEDEYESLT